MELKRLIAEDSKSALQNVRTTYGEDALIVSTNKIGTKTNTHRQAARQRDKHTWVDKSTWAWTSNRPTRRQVRR